MKKVASGVTTVYHYDLAGNLIAESDQLGNVQKEYVYLGGGAGATPLAMIDSGQVYYHHTDHLGTPVPMSNALGQTAWEAGYSAFGAAAVSPGAAVVSNLRLPGQYFDAETALHYNWHRYYAPELGRYLQPDPIGTDLMSSASAHVASLIKPDALGRMPTWHGAETNLYGYVLNDPINSVDPLGLADGLIPWICDKYPFNGNIKPGFDPQTPPGTPNSCDWPAGGLNGGPAQQCCQRHDRCYERYNCNDTSWAGPPGACQLVCNIPTAVCVPFHWITGH